MDKNLIKAAYHADRIDRNEPSPMGPDHYDRILADLAKQQEGESEIAERQNEEANGRFE